MKLDIFPFRKELEKEKEKCSSLIYLRLDEKTYYIIFDKIYRYLLHIDIEIKVGARWN